MKNITALSIVADRIDAPGRSQVPWVIANRDAFERPRSNFEASIVTMVNALALYLDAHQRTYGSKLGNDCVLREHWLDIARGLHGLLNGETGRLDCGTVDGIILALVKHAGIDESQL